MYDCILDERLKLCVVISMINFQQKKNLSHMQTVQDETDH